MQVTALFVIAAASLIAEDELIRHQGHMRASLHCSVDLDAADVECAVTLDGDGTEPPQHISSKSDDFRVESDGLHLYLKPRHGTQLSQGILAAAGLTGCSAATYAKGRLRVDGLAQGVHICVRTNEGRFAELAIVEAPPRKASRVVFDYKVWERR